MSSDKTAEAEQAKERGESLASRLAAIRAAASQGTSNG
jgi:hypothetical protein